MNQLPGNRPVDDFAVERAEPLTRAAEEGAKRTLAEVGLDGHEAALDIRDPWSPV